MGKMMIYVAGIMIWALYDIQQGTRMGVFFSSSCSSFDSLLPRCMEMELEI